MSGLSTEFLTSQKDARLSLHHKFDFSYEDYSLFRAQSSELKTARSFNGLASPSLIFLVYKQKYYQEKNLQLFTFLLAATGCEPLPLQLRE
jgi:hypothetical protein